MEDFRIAENLKKLRKEKGWSQQKLAEKAKLAYNTITKIEQGRTKYPSIQIVEKIADAFKIGIDELVR